MTLLDIHQTISENRALIASTWEFFLTVHITLFALIFLIDPRRISMVSRVVVLIGYLGFMYINYRAQVDNYEYTLALIEWGRTLEENVSTTEAVLTTVFEAGWILNLLPFIYLVSSLAGMAIIMIPQPGRIPADADKEGEATAL